MYSIRRTFRAISKQVLFHHGYPTEYVALWLKQTAVASSKWPASAT